MFKPGDKVMRVGTPPPNDPRSIPCPWGKPEFGRVYCVLHCWMTSLGPQIWLAGIGPPTPPIYNYLATGFPAKYFRKLEDIKASVELRRQSLGHRVQ